MADAPIEDPSELEILLIRLGESSPGFPVPEKALEILESQTTSSPHKLALLPTRVKPAARAEGGPIILEMDGKALAEMSIVRVEARKDFGPEMKEEWAKAGVADAKSWVIVKGFKRIDKPLHEVAVTIDGKGLDRTVGNRQFRWLRRLKAGEVATSQTGTPKKPKAPKAEKAPAPAAEAEPATEAAPEAAAPEGGSTEQ